MKSNWRKSSYSGDQGGECDEYAPLGPLAWRESSYSSDQGGNCIEIAEAPLRHRGRPGLQDPRRAGAHLPAGRLHRPRHLDLCRGLTALSVAGSRDNTSDFVAVRLAVGRRFRRSAQRSAS